MKLLLVFVFLPICLGQVTEENCINLVDNFMSIINGSILNVCSSNVSGPQCCSQFNEDALGMTLNDALNSADLGSELRTMQDNVMALYSALTDLRLSLINDVLGPLMNTSADLTVYNAQEFLDELDRIREEILYNINSTIAGNLDFNLTAEFTRFFIEGLSTFYFNCTFEFAGAPASFITNEMQSCAINNIYEHFYPMMEQAEIAALGGRIQQIAVTFDVARAALSSLQTVLNALDHFTATYTCTNVWTLQYACPRCAGQDAPLCLGRCDEVLIGCMSSLQQVIVQLNVLLEFARSSVNSLISGNPYNNINVNTVANDYREIFTNIVTRDRDYLIIEVPEICNFGSRRKRSVDSPIVHHKRQVVTIEINLASVTIDQSIVTMINNTLLPPLMNVSLNRDRGDLCDSLNSDGLVNCTKGVDDIGSSTIPTVGAEINDQVDNTAGIFNLTQLREQARSVPYVMTSLLMNRSDIMMLYEYVLPGHPVPNLDFLNDATGIDIATSVTVSPSVSPSTIPSDIPSNTPLISVRVTELNPPSTTTTSTPVPSNTPPRSSAIAVCHSLFITLISLLLASIL